MQHYTIFEHDGSVYIALQHYSVYSEEENTSTYCWKSVKLPDDISEVLVKVISDLPKIEYSIY